MALLATQSIVRTGLAPAFAAVSASDTFTPDKDTYIEVKNANAGACTVTVTTPRTDAIGNAIADNAVSVPATTGDRIIGPFPAEHYADPTTGLATVTFSPSASVTVGVFKIAQP